MPLITEEQMLRAHFEERTASAYGWDNFRRHSDGSYVASMIQACWQGFKYGVAVGKQLQVEKTQQKDDRELFGL